MAKPLWVGMPPHDIRLTVPKPEGVGGNWGEIRCGGSCKDDYKRIEIFHDDGGRIIKLQHAAMESFKAAEKALGYSITLTGSWRSCELQTKLYASDSHRFAPPDKTAHVRGLAIDVSTAISVRKLTEIKTALARRHWHQVRPDDEPWHLSFGIEA